MAGEGEEEGRRLNPSFWVGIGVPPRDSYWQRGSSRHLLSLFPTFVAKCFLNSQILQAVLRIVRTIDDIGNWSQYTYHIIRSSRTTRSFLNISNFFGKPAKKAEIRYLEAQLSTLRAIAKPRKKASISTEPPIADLRPIDGFFCDICVTGLRLQNAIYKRMASPSYGTPRPRSGVFQFTPCPFPSPQTAH